MSIHLDEFNNLLAGEQFWENDVFQIAEEVAARLDAEDWISLSASWDQKTAQYKERFFVSLGTTIMHPGLVTFAFKLLNAPDADQIAEGLSILRSASPKIGQYISSSNIETLAAVWRKNPSQRDAIQQVLWSKEKSGELRHFLSLERWSDADEREV